ncbi:MAG: CueP family metal-binding protein [Candidatus Izemoplasmataceae bacterium]|jgi:hypothetical protein
MKSINITIIAFIVLIGSFAGLRSFYMSENQVLKRHNLDGLTPMEMVDELERRTIDPNQLIASISADTLTLRFGDTVFQYDIPEEYFYLSVAPYINHTHPCGTHNLTTCRAELANETLYIVIIDENDNVLFDGEATALDNGFIGIWLPRGVQANITVTYNGLSATHDFSTYQTDYTCLTTMQLK